MNPVQHVATWFHRRRDKAVTDHRPQEVAHGVSDSTESDGEVALDNITPHVLAATMLQIVMEKNQQWQSVDAQLTSVVRAKFPLACEFYELWIFLGLLRQRFGRQISQLVESSLKVIVENDIESANPYSWFEAAFSRAHALGGAEDAPDDIRLRMDYQVADQLLAGLSGPVQFKEEIRNPLAASLSYARIWAENVYPGVIAKIEFDPISIVMVNRETAYKGTTNRWRDNPGCFERQLQRMEGNPVFPEAQRNPSDEEIQAARAKDDADLENLSRDVKLAFADFKRSIGTGPIKGSQLVDFLHYSVEPLMVRAAEIGDHPLAQRYVERLEGFIIARLKTLQKALPEGSGSIEDLQKGWRRRTNRFLAQCDREDTPITNRDKVPSLLCENLETFEGVLKVYEQLDPEIIESLYKVVLLVFEMATEEGFVIPGAEAKMSLLNDYVHPQ